jgi:deoxyribonuclease V
MLYTAFIISFMKNPRSHLWDIDSTQARELQSRLSLDVVRCNDGIDLKLIAGIDVSVSRYSRIGRAAVVVLSYPEAVHRGCTGTGKQSIN